MRAHGAAAALHAVCDYDPSRCVLFSAFLYQRVMASALTRYRQEWAYALHCVSEVEEDGDRGHNVKAALYMGEACLAPTLVYESLRCALSRLSEPNCWLIKQLFWEECTEAEIAEKLGISHQAVSKRKGVILQDLRNWLDMSKKNFKK